jgi:hypothetical protein
MCWGPFLRSSVLANKQGVLPSLKRTGLALNEPVDILQLNQSLTLSSNSTNSFCKVKVLSLAYQEWISAANSEYEILGSGACFHPITMAWAGAGRGAQRAKTRFDSSMIINTGMAVPPLVKKCCIISGCSSRRIKRRSMKGLPAAALAMAGTFCAASPHQCSVMSSQR